MRYRWLAITWIVAALACATPARELAPGTSGVWGYLSLVPREGVEVEHGGGSYGDRRLAHTELVDYSRPGFAVVYAEGEPLEDDALELSIRTSTVSTRMDPQRGVVASGGALVVHNRSDRPHTVSCPEAGFLARVEPGQSVEIRTTRAGEHSLYLLDVDGAASTVFAAPGPHVVVSDSGRYELADLAPGRRRLRTWHPRFPPTAHWVELESGRMHRMDIELGVSHRQEESDAPH